MTPAEFLQRVSPSEPPPEAAPWLAGEPLTEELARMLGPLVGMDPAVWMQRESLARGWWWVYVVRCEQNTYYVGCTTNPHRRVRQHNQEIKGGARYTSRFTGWALQAVYGPYLGQSEALKAERALKRGKRGLNRTRWSPTDSEWCRGPGTLSVFV